MKSEGWERHPSKSERLRWIGVPPWVQWTGACARSAGAAPPRNPSSSNCGNTIPVVQRSND